MKNSVTHEQRVEYLKMALALCQVSISIQTADLLIEVFDRLDKLQGNFSVDDAVTIYHQNQKKYENQQHEEKPVLPA